MNYISAKVELINPEIFDGMNERIELAARECYQSTHRIGPGTAGRFVEMLVKNKHTAMIEHGGLISFRFTVDRGVSHEFVRHRMASFAQESTRYCNYAENGNVGEMNFIDIQNGMKLDTKMKDLPIARISKIWEIWYLSCRQSEKAYNEMIALGATPQIARGVLPNSLKTSIVISANPREWLESIVPLRTAVSAHPQMREIMLQTAEILVQQNPSIFAEAIK